MTIGKKLLLGSIAVLALTLLVVGIAWYANRSMQSAYGGFLDHSKPLVTGAAALRADELALLANFRGYLLYGTDQYLKAWKHDRDEYASDLAHMQELIGSDSARADLTQLKDLDARQAQLEFQALQLRTRESENAARNLVRDSPYRDQILQLLTAFAARQEALLATSRRTLAAKVQFISGLMLGGVFAIFIVGLICTALLTRAISRPLEIGISQLSSASAEILATTSQVASSTTETAASITQTSATVEEIRQTAHLSSEKAKYVSETAQQSVQASQSGKTAVIEVVAGLQRLKDEMANITETVLRMSEHGQAVAEIMTTVGDLADQANLLAVNAAIEAAKAGEHGRGFAVVAQEVRALAEHSKQATVQARAILTEVQKATTTAVMAAERGSKATESAARQAEAAGETIRALAESNTESAQAALQIAASSQQQLAGMDQIALAMDNIETASAQNAAGTKQAEQAAHDLKELAVSLRAMLSGNGRGPRPGATGPASRHRRPPQSAEELNAIE